MRQPSSFWAGKGERDNLLVGEMNTRTCVAWLYFILFFVPFWTSQLHHSGSEAEYEDALLRFVLGLCLFCIFSLFWDSNRVHAGKEGMLQ